MSEEEFFLPSSFFLLSSFFFLLSSFFFLLSFPCRTSAPVVISPSECEFSIRWVYGVPSDPQKQARNRVINRVFGEAIKALGGA
eukprot:SAG31_NODE_26825_length_435_cov_7.863095_2_plen_83_part_01